MHQPGAAHPERVPEGDGAAVGIDVFGVIGQAEHAQHRQRLGGEGLVEFNDADLVERHPGALQQLRVAAGRTDPHDAGRHPGDGHRLDGSQGRPASGGTRRP